MMIMMMIKIIMMILQSEGGRDRRPGSRRKSQGDSPLDALFNMASNFEAMKAKSGRNLDSSSLHFSKCISPISISFPWNRASL